MLGKQWQWLAFLSHLHISDRMLYITSVACWTTRGVPCKLWAYVRQQLQADHNGRRSAHTKLIIDEDPGLVHQDPGMTFLENEHLYMYVVDTVRFVYYVIWTLGQTDMASALGSLLPAFGIWWDVMWSNVCCCQYCCEANEWSRVYQQQLFVINISSIHGYFHLNFSIFWSSVHA